MDDVLKAIQDYPDISFIDGYSIKRLEEEMVSWFKEKKMELTGETVSLGRADDRRIILQTGAYFIFQGYMFVDHMGKMGLLKYSQGEYLDNLGAFKGVPRLKAQCATVTIRFQMKEARSSVTGIPKGTRITAGDGVYFATDNYDEILAGELYTDVGATCVISGEAGNHYDIGDISIIVDPVPFIDSASNITQPANGTDLEPDDPSYRERIYLFPSSYSAAGTEDAYQYLIREFNPDITDIWITTPSDSTVQIQYLLKDGEIPGEESRNALFEYLSDKSRKVLCDKIQIMAPETINYCLELTYYIGKSDRSRSDIIQKKVAEAVRDYIQWQKTAIGRDINPDILNSKLIAAGAKRSVITSPIFTVVPEGAVACLTEETVTYGGLEDD